MALQIDRWTKMMDNRVKNAERLNLDTTLVKLYFN